MGRTIALNNPTRAEAFAATPPLAALAPIVAVVAEVVARRGRVHCDVGTCIQLVSDSSRCVFVAPKGVVRHVPRNAAEPRLELARFAEVSQLTPRGDERHLR